MCWADECAITEGDLGAATEAAESAICLITTGMVGFDLDGRPVVEEERKRNDQRHRIQEHVFNRDERMFQNECFRQAESAGKKRIEDGRQRKEEGDADVVEGEEMTTSEERKRGKEKWSRDVRPTRVRPKVKR